MSRLATTLLASTVLLALLMPLASAQTPLDPAVEVRVPQRGLDVDAGGTTAIPATVTNVGNVAGTVELRFVAPEGWHVTLDPATPFALAAGSSLDVDVVLTAPDVDAGRATGLLEVVAEITDGSGRSASATTTLAVNRIDPLVAPPPSPWYATTTARLAMAAGVVILGLAILGSLLWRRSRRRAAHWLDQETGITLASTHPPRAYGATRDVVHRLLVGNASGRPRVAHVRVVSAPPGWRASLSVSRMPLSRGETLPVTLHATPDATVPAGATAIVLIAARAEEAQVHEEIATIVVHAPPPPARIAVVDVSPRRPILRR